MGKYFEPTQAYASGGLNVANSSNKLHDQSQFYLFDLRFTLKAYCSCHEWRGLCTHWGSSSPLRSFI